MTKVNRLTPQEIERLLEGQRSPDGRHASLEEALRGIRNEFSAHPQPEVRAQHLQAMMAAFGQSSTAPAPARRLQRGRIARRAGIAVAASVLVGGSALAATGSLPTPAQDAIAKVAHGIGFDIPHSTAHPTPQADLPGPRFAAAKKAWLECVKERGADACGPKPQAQDFVTPSPKASHEPASTEPSEHGVGNPHHSPVAPKATANPGHGGENPGNGDAHPTPKVTVPANAGSSGSGSGGVDRTPKPIPTPHS
jgi:hypothetical protein